MSILILLLTLGLGASAFYMGREYGQFKERRQWENRLALPPPPEDGEPPQLPENVGECGPYRTSQPPVVMKLPPRRRGLFSEEKVINLTELFRHYRFYGASAEQFIVDNSSYVQILDIQKSLSELLTYIETRNTFLEDLDELQELFVAAISERNSQEDARLLAQFLDGGPHTYSSRLTILAALGRIWPPNRHVISAVRGQIHLNNCRNKHAQEIIRQKAVDVFNEWYERDPVAVTLAMCE